MLKRYGDTALVESVRRADELPGRCTDLARGSTEGLRFDLRLPWRQLPSDSACDIDSDAKALGEDILDLEQYLINVGDLADRAALEWDHDLRFDYLGHPSLLYPV